MEKAVKFSAILKTEGKHLVTLSSINDHEGTKRLAFYFKESYEKEGKKNVTCEFKTETIESLLYSLVK